MSHEAKRQQGKHGSGNRPADAGPAIWGVWGAGRFAEQQILPAFATTQRLARIATRDPHRRGQTAPFDGEPRYCDLHELLTDDAITHVYIGLPTGLHHDATLTALDAGKHVLVEKPYTLSTIDAEALTRHRSAGRQIAVAWMYRHHPRWQHIFQLVDDGTIGDITDVQFTYRFHEASPSPARLSRELGGGAFGLVGVYGLHIALKLCGPPTSLRTTGATEPGAAVEHSCQIDLEFANARASITCTNRAPVPYQHVALHGTEASLLIDTPINPRPDEPTTTRLLHPDGSTTTPTAPADQFALQAHWAGHGMADYDDFELDFIQHPTASEAIIRSLTAEASPTAG